MNKNQTLKIMIEELYCMERIINIKSTLIGFPGKIISTREINDIKAYFEEFERKVDKLLKSFLAEKEKEAKSKKPKTSETKERFRIIEELFEEVKNTQKNIFAKAKLLFSDYERKEHEIFSNEIIPRKHKVILNDGRMTSNTSSEAQISQKEEILIIEKIFLNTKVTINDVDILKKKPTLDEEKNFLIRLLNLVELYPNCQSKQYILLDFYMNLYNLCIENNFTLQQISTIMSIFYFMFSYSFCWISTENKISEIYNAILSYHSINNPPFSYYIFNQSQKKLLTEYFDTTFIKNFSFFEVLFRYDVSICFFNQAPKIEATKIIEQQNRKVDKAPIGSGSKVISEYEMEEENEEKGNENVEGTGDKSQSELEDEKEIEAMKNFVNSFYQAVGDLEMQKQRNDANAVLGKNMEEANQAKLFLEIKVPEIQKDINEQVDVVTRNALKTADQEMQERAAAKGGKK